jgi:O-antigen ligase
MRQDLAARHGTALCYSQLLSSDVTAGQAGVGGKPLTGKTRRPAWAPGVVAGGGPLRDSTRIDHRLGFAMAVAIVFAYCSQIHEILTTLAGFNLYLLYVFAAPALLMLVLTGGIRSAFRGRPTMYWTGFVIWIAVAIPFSSWSGGSYGLLTNYLKSGMVTLLVLAGMVVTWRECKVVMWAIAAAAVVNLVSARLFQANAHSAARLGLEFGSIRNPNDLAAHLVLVLPFLLWMVLSKRTFLLRLMACLGGCLGVYLILKTASRGAALALLVQAAFFLFRGTARQRLAFVVLAPIALVVLLAAVPREAWQRIRTFSTTETVRVNLDESDAPAIAGEAAASASARMYVLGKSIEYTVQHPFFGVGPGQFASYEGRHERVLGEHGYWHVTHNSFTQVASECGIPGLVLFVAGIVSTFLMLNRTYREARRRPNCEDIRTAAFCIMLGMVGFCTAATFLSLAYTFHLPMLGGLAISIAFAAKDEFALRGRKPRADSASIGGQPRVPAPTSGRNTQAPWGRDFEQHTRGHRTFSREPGLKGRSGRPMPRGTRPNVVQPVRGDTRPERT